MKKLYLNSINAAITFYKSYKRIFFMFSKKNYIKEISIYSYRSQNHPSMNSHPSICLSHYYLTSEQPKKKNQKKKLLAGALLAFLLK